MSQVYKLNYMDDYFTSMPSCLRISCMLQPPLATVANKLLLTTQFRDWIIKFKKSQHKFLRIGKSTICIYGDFSKNLHKDFTGKMGWTLEEAIYHIERLDGEIIKGRVIK